MSFPTRNPVLRAALCLAISGTVVAPCAALAQQPSRSDEGASSRLDTIVVTARRRTESLQDTPIAISAFSAADLERQQIDDLLDLNAVVPTLAVSEITGAGVAQIFLRGAGQDDSQAASEQPIGIYIDGVPYTKAPGAILDIIEFERVEVLRGPQGTLYGRNSTGGAIKYVTRRPSLETPRVVADATLGSFDRLDVRGSFSSPLSETFAVKLDVISRSNAGFVRDALAEFGDDRPRRYNQTDRQSARLSALWEPDDRLSVYVTADRTLDNAGPQSGIPAISSRPQDNLVDGRISQAAPLYGPRLAAPTLAGDQTLSGSGVMANIEYAFDNFTLTTILGYRSFDLSQATDTDSGPNATDLVNQLGEPIPQRGASFDYIRDWSNDTLTGELQLASADTSGWQWVAGLFAMREQNDSDDIFGRFSEPGGFQFASGFQLDQRTTSFALFGEATYPLTDALELSVGGRYTRDRKSLSRSHFGALGLPPLGTPYDLSTSDTWSQFTPRVILDYQVAERVSVFASFAKGFQAGAYQSFPFNPAVANVPFAPTKVENYEVGLRSQWFDGLLTANLTAFRSDYTDLPSTVLASQGTFEVLTNDVRLQGLELDMSILPTDNFALFVSAGFTDDKFVRSVVAPSLVPGASENRLKYVADITARVAAEYRFDLAQHGNVRLNANLTYNGDYFMSTVNTPFAYQDAYTLLGAELRYQTADQRWSVALGGRNLTDKLYQRRASAGGGGVIYFGPPRTWYLTLRYEY